MDTQQGKKIHKRGDVVRVEPYDLQLLNPDPSFREAFHKVNRLAFFEKMQRGHPEVVTSINKGF
jgi:hypothetical protein